jgi:hypothetical protein
MKDFNLGVTAESGVGAESDVASVLPWAWLLD